MRADVCEWQRILCGYATQYLVCYYSMEKTIWPNLNASCLHTVFPETFLGGVRYMHTLHRAGGKDHTELMGYVCLSRAEIMQASFILSQINVLKQNQRHPLMTPLLRGELFCGNLKLKIHFFSIEDHENCHCRDPWIHNSYYHSHMQKWLLEAACDSIYTRWLHQVGFTERAKPYRSNKNYFFKKKCKF